MSTSQISEDKSILIRTRNICDSEAYRVIQEQAMSKRVPTDEIARAIIHADGILSFNGRSQQLGRLAIAIRKYPLNASIDETKCVCAEPPGVNIFLIQQEALRHTSRAAEHKAGGCPLNANSGATVASVNAFVHFLIEHGKAS